MNHNLVKLLISVSYIWCISCGEKLFNKKPLNFDGLKGGLLGAFVDYNFDRITDAFLVTESGLEIQLVEGVIDDEPYLRNRSDIKCTFDRDSDDRVVGVIPSDFTGNSYVDVLVVTKSINSSFESFDEFHTIEDKTYKLWLFHSNPEQHLECNTTHPLADNIRSFPLTLDYNGDMITDFIVETDHCLKELWIGPPQGFSRKCLEGLHTNQRMSYPNSNAFIDLSNPKDFTPDIFISGTNTMEYWFNNRGFKTGLNISYPNKDVYKFVGQSTFVDIDFDGEVEHIIPVCKGSGIDTCAEPQILLLSQNGAEYEWIEILDMNKELFPKLTFAELKLFDYLDLYVTLRAGDIDSDGYPDLVTVMRNRNTSQSHAVLLMNCKTKSEDKIAFRRKFRIQWLSDDVLGLGANDDRNVHLVSMFDFNEDGNLDLLISSHDTNQTDVRLSGYKNSGESSANFLKVLVTTGICHSSDCPQIRAPLIGPQVCYSPSEGKQVSCGGQASQTSNFALQLPFVLFGLGDIPNFIENLTVSIPSGAQELRKQTWFELIPDSSIIIIPYPADDSHKWVQKLYLDPKYFAFQTLITLTSFCCLLVLIIAILHKRDLRQDIIEHREYRKHIIKSL